jgi:hypothetical protein
LKKFLIILIIAAYSCASMGYSVNAHYCMGKLVGFGNYHTEEGKCKECGMMMKKSKGCCKDKTKFVQLKQDKIGKKEVHFDFAKNVFVVPFAKTYNLHLSLQSPLDEKLLIAKAAPNIRNQKRYILYQSFLI